METVLFCKNVECLETIESLVLCVTILSGVAGFGLGFLGIFFHYCSKNKDMEDDFYMYAGFCYIPLIFYGFFGNENITLTIAAVLDVMLLRELPTNADYAKIFFLLGVAMGILCVVIRRKLGTRAVLKSAIATATLFAFGLAVCTDNTKAGVVMNVFASFLFYLVVVWNIWGIRRIRTRVKKEGNTEAAKPKAKKEPVKTVPAWVLWACVGMFAAAVVLMVGVYIPGVRQQAAEQAESARNEEYNQGYYAGYDKGQEEQWVSDRQSLVVRGKNLKMIIESVESEYGIEPAKAYAILNAYNNNADHGGYSWDEYQEAIQVIIYTVSLIPYR